MSVIRDTNPLSCPSVGKIEDMTPRREGDMTLRREGDMIIRREGIDN